MKVPLEGHELCPICVGPTDHRVWDTPDSDWRERVEQAASNRMDKTDMNRAERLLAAGLDCARAVEYAQAREPVSLTGLGGGYEVDVATFERLVKRCGVELAALIMKPLSS